MLVLIEVCFMTLDNTSFIELYFPTTFFLNIKMFISDYCGQEETYSTVLCPRVSRFFCTKFGPLVSTLIQTNRMSNVFHWVDLVCLDPNCLFRERIISRTGVELMDLLCYMYPHFNGCVMN